ncbi:metallophosphoesterase family protein [Mycolicibacterium arenosum]|uniref:Calcineurin-like phosphoesterase domain-containing protein n=1 Tax=Mycolicibacterium arenosum TaxID=2952157 RepID=A0ABT1M4F2_9MYCO|nr:hypothetical protein [Mycolicibacterium sp. CAU 1645]MCP9274045.1 hypothetical protein [Mycolicibacterium sp. CAU 1645]
MIVRGVRLDHAWTDLGASFGTALRTWSRQALALVVQQANDRGVRVLLIAGDLFDRSYASRATVDYASQILGTFSGDVVIVPGRSDWIDDTSLYNTHAWAANTSICASPEYEPCRAAASVWASAWTSPGGAAPRVPAAGEPRVLIRAGTDDGALGVPDLVHDPREPGGCVVLIDSAEPQKPAERIDLPDQPGSLVDVDVTDAATTEELDAALEAGLTGGPLLLRLRGTLAPAVLLPGFGGPDRNLPSEVVLDLDGLSFAMPTVDPTDRSARAEFLHAMAYANTPELQRHQTIALGLAALDASAQGA